MLHNEKDRHGFGDVAVLNGDLACRLISFDNSRNNLSNQHVRRLVERFGISVPHATTVARLYFGEAR